MLRPTCDSEKSVHFETLGCRLNQLESEGAAGFFLRKSWRVDMKPSSAGGAEDPSVFLCVLNTCAVTGKAEQKARRTIRLLLKIFPAAALVVTGCYAELSKNEIESIDARIALLPGKAKSALSLVPDFLDGLFSARGALGAEETAVALRNFFAGEGRTRGQVAPQALAGQKSAPGGEGAASPKIAPRPAERIAGPKVAAPAAGLPASLKIAPGGDETAPGLSASQKNAAATEPFLLFPKRFLAHSRAALKIQDGCDNNCSYCAIRLARGRSVSLAPELVARRVQALEEEGQSEVVLTGVNIGLYRGTDGGAEDLAGLLRLILSRTKKIAVRLSSVHPQTITKDFCEAIRDPRVRPHFHISVQSGSDSVLKKMRRPYGRGDVLKACSLLKKAKANPFLACDVIAGFPGESDADFADTLFLMKEAGFVKAHAFPFSPRPGTEAAGLFPKIPERVKGERVAALNEYSAAAKIAYIDSFAGKALEAVSQGASGRGGVFRAVTENFIHAEIPLAQGQSAPEAGKTIRVHICGAKQAAIGAGEEWEASALLV